ncbi:MAG: AAA family ATPase [Clostridia bacterium]
MFIDKLVNNNLTKTDYPFIPLVNNCKSISFTSPVTIFCGDNGAGKSTLIKILAQRSSCFSLSAYSINEDIAKVTSCFVIERRATPKTKFFFSAEDFIDYIKQVCQMKKEAKEQINEIESSSLSDTAKSYAVQPHASTLFQLNNMYKRELSTSSHGEGFLTFFNSRLRDNGLYLIDEPESALSYQNQYNLAYIIQEYATHHNCQFIISTHSPIITAIPLADIKQIEGNQLKTIKFEEIENINFLKMFLSRYQKMFE